MNHSRMGLELLNLLDLDPYMFRFRFNTLAYMGEGPFSFKYLFDAK